MLLAELQIKQAKVREKRYTVSDYLQIQCRAFTLEVLRRLMHTVNMGGLMFGHVKDIHGCLLPKSSL